MQVRYSIRVVVRAALVLLVAAMLISVWELMASQTPDSPFSISMLPGPIASLRDTTVILALALLSVAWLIPWAYQDREPRKTLAFVFIGIVLIIGGSFYGAATGMPGVQITDPRTDAIFLFWMKHIGWTILGICLFDLARRVTFRTPPE